MSLGLILEFIHHPADGVARMRTFFVAEFAVFAFIPIFAAMMARGIGL